MTTKLERWERAVQDHPQKAAIAGPPNWLVQEEWKGRDKAGKEIEPLDDAAQRVRVRYGLPAEPTKLRTVAEAVEWYQEKMSQPGALEERERRIRAALDKAR